MYTSFKESGPVINLYTYLQKKYAKKAVKKRQMMCTARVEAKLIQQFPVNDETSDELE